MSIRHVVILKAKAGEFEALARTRDQTADKLLPMFEVARLTDKMRQAKYLASSKAPVATYLNKVADGIFNAWGNRPAMIDFYQWKPSASAEDGTHVVAHIADNLAKKGMTVVPVIGYDRWEDATYKLGLKSIAVPKDGQYCLRLDTHAIDDSADPNFFKGRVEEIAAEMDLDPSVCSVLVDFGDATTQGIDRLVDQAGAIIELAAELGFGKIITAGCSMPKSVNLAVKDHNDAGLIIRKEMVLWQALVAQFPELKVLYGDYGIRGPSANDEIQSKYINGKIRHTVKQQTFIVRGHPFVDDGSAEQMYDLAGKVVKSTHYLGESFSWGDARIKSCSKEEFVGSPTNWIAIDTNHHIEFVSREVYEVLQPKVGARSNA